MGFLNWLKNLFRTDNKVYMNLDEDQIKRDEIVKSQQQKILSQEAQLQEYTAKEQLKNDEQSYKEKQNKLNKKLKEQAEDLKYQKVGKMISLDKFFYHLYKNQIPKGRWNVRSHMSKWAKGIEFRDKNNEVILGKYGGLFIMNGGKLCFKDENGDILAIGKSLSHIISKPDAFENMIRDKKILLPVDKDGNWMEDLEYKEIPEPVDAIFDEETGRLKKIVWSKVKTSEVKKIIADLKERENHLESELEREETVSQKLRQENNDLKRTLKLTVSNNEVLETNFSRNLNKFIESDKRVGELHTQITKLTELKAMYESIIDKKDHIIDKMITKLDSTSEPTSRILRAEIKDDLEFYRAILPERVEIKQEVPVEDRPSVQPGEIIAR